jgi:two-component system, chemotaxis family, chemotaxis protein CheY
VKAAMAINVLLVDDSAVMRAMVMKTLHMSGLPVGEIHQAGNGRDALALLERHGIDLVMLDVSMPVMRGDEMLEELRSRDTFADVPVVVVSSERSEENVDRMRELGAVFVHKPFTPEQLRAVVLDATGMRDECCT